MKNIITDVIVSDYDFDERELSEVREYIDKIISQNQEYHNIYFYFDPICDGCSITSIRGDRHETEDEYKRRRKRNVEKD